MVEDPACSFAAYPLIIILFPVLPWIVKGVFWIISLPLEAVAALFKSIDKARKKRKEKKEE